MPKGDLGGWAGTPLKKCFSFFSTLLGLHPYDKCMSTRLSRQLVKLCLNGFNQFNFSLNLAIYLPVTVKNWPCCSKLQLKQYFFCGRTHNGRSSYEIREYFIVFHVGVKSTTTSSTLPKGILTLRGLGYKLVNPIYPIMT